MTDQVERLFVYGTLMPGYGNYARIADHVHSASPGTTQGILVDLGAFPALIRGNGRVKGMVLNVNAEALKITDFIEGCHPDREHSLYVREKVHVLLDDDTTMTAWTYFFAHPNQVRAEQRLVCAEIDGQSIYRWPSD